MRKKYVYPDKLAGNIPLVGNLVKLLKKNH